MAVTLASVLTFQDSGSAQEKSTTSGTNTSSKAIRGSESISFVWQKMLGCLFGKKPCNHSSGRSDKQWGKTAVLYSCGHFLKAGAAMFFLHSMQWVAVLLWFCLSFSALAAAMAFGFLLPARACCFESFSYTCGHSFFKGYCIKHCLAQGKLWHLFARHMAGR